MEAAKALPNGIWKKKRTVTTPTHRVRVIATQILSTEISISTRPCRQMIAKSVVTPNQRKTTLLSNSILSCKMT